MTFFLQFIFRNWQYNPCNNSFFSNVGLFCLCKGTIVAWLFQLHAVFLCGGPFTLPLQKRSHAHRGRCDRIASLISLGGINEFNFTFFDKQMELLFRKVGLRRAKVND